MGYNGKSGLYTAFPMAKAPKAPKAAKACAYGPRMANGRCPPKPRTPRAPKALKITDPFNKPGRRAPSAAARVGRAADKLVITGAVSAARMLPRIGQALKIATPGAALAAGGKTAATLFGAVAAAGLAAFGVTRALINSHVATEAGRRELAALAADAYRKSRLDAAKQLRRKLTGAEQQTLAAAFKANLAKIGLTTDNLRSLHLGFFETGF